MAIRVGEILVLSVLLVFSPAARGQTSDDCSTAIVSLASCLNFVSGKVTVPSTQCCSALKPVIEISPVCLCLLLGYGDDTGTTIPSDFNQTLAKQLPPLCSLSANEDKCPALVGGTPTAAPVASGPAAPPTTGTEGPLPPPSSAATLLSSVGAILSCAAVVVLASLL